MNPYSVIYGLLYVFLKPACSFPGIMFVSMKKFSILFRMHVKNFPKENCYTSKVIYIKSTTKVLYNTNCPVMTIRLKGFVSNLPNLLQAVLKIHQPS